jgi:hypothetical protein
LGLSPAAAELLLTKIKNLTFWIKTKN